MNGICIVESFQQLVRQVNWPFLVNNRRFWHTLFLGFRLSFHFGFWNSFGFWTKPTFSIGCVLPFPLNPQIHNRHHQVGERALNDGLPRRHFDISYQFGRGLSQWCPLKDLSQVTSLDLFKDRCSLSSVWERCFPWDPIRAALRVPEICWGHRIFCLWALCFGGLVVFMHGH